MNVILIILGGVMLAALLIVIALVTVGSKLNQALMRIARQLEEKSPND